MKNIYQNMEAIIIEKDHNKQKITVTFGREKPEIILKTEFYEIGTYKNDNTKKFFEEIKAKDKLDIIFGELGWAVRDSNLKEKKYHSNDTLILNDTTTVEEYQTEKEKLKNFTINKYKHAFRTIFNTEFYFKDSTFDGEYTIAIIKESGEVIVEKIYEISKEEIEKAIKKITKRMVCGACCKKEEKNEKQEKLITHEQAKLAINILQEDEGENITWTVDRIEQLELLLEYVEQHQFKEVLEKRQRSCME